MASISGDVARNPRDDFAIGTPGSRVPIHHVTMMIGNARLSPALLLLLLLLLLLPLLFLVVIPEGDLLLPLLLQLLLQLQLLLSLLLLLLLSLLLPLPLGKPSLQAWPSLRFPSKGALAPRVCLSIPRTRQQQNQHSHTFFH